MGTTEKYMAKRKPGKCPACGSKNVLRICYGMPGPELVEASRQGKVILGGCCVSPEDPKWQCSNCAAAIYQDR